MAFEHFPYTNFHELNLDWILAEIKKLDEAFENITEDILSQANQYTDRSLRNYQSQLEAFRAELNERFSQYVSLINANIDIMKNDIALFDSKIDNAILGVNARTDLKIEENNDMIKEYIDSTLIDLKVINYFTGEKVGIQSMLDYLAQFHLANSIKYSELASRSKTYTQLAAYNMTYTDLVQRGGAIIV